MQNPWLEIAHEDYEGHMTEVGQAQVLNKLTKYALEKYKPQTFALLGCATGNGLEHVNAEVTNTVYAVDINPDYLQVVEEKFSDRIKNLQTLNIDIAKSELTFNDIDLVFAGLILEYVEPIGALNRIIKVLSDRGVLVIVIQKNKKTTFVSKTKYKSLEKLSGVSHEVNEQEVHEFLIQNKMVLSKREEVELTKEKSFVVLEYCSAN